MRLPRPSRSQLGTGTLVVAALAFGQVLNEHLPDGSDGSRLFERDVAIGDTVSMRTGDLTPRSVKGATSVLRSIGPSMRSPGVAVVLAFDFVSRGEPALLQYGELRDGEGGVTRFRAGSGRNQVSCPSGPVGIVVHCTAIVEADPDRLVGATIGLSRDPLDPRFDDMAVVDLDVDAADVRAWKATETLEVVVNELDGMG